MRLVTEQHAVGGRQRQRIGGALLPGQVLGPRHQLAILHAAELRERAVGSLVAPNALRGGKHRIAAVAFLVVAVVLVAVDDDFVADLPAPHLRTDRPDDPRRVRSGDMKGMLVHVEHGHRFAQRGPHAVVVDAGGHHENEHVVAVERPGRHDLDLHRLLRRPVPFLAHDPGVHRGRHVAERGDLADFVEVLLRRRRRVRKFRRRAAHGASGHDVPYVARSQARTQELGWRSASADFRRLIAPQHANMARRRMKINPTFETFEISAPAFTARKGISGYDQARSARSRFQTRWGIRRARA